MKTNDINKHRANVMLHLMYIREMVDANNKHLKELNGRVRKNEITISWIKGIGITVSSILGALLTWLGFGK
jgi:glucose-6-phosphate isomerase